MSYLGWSKLGLQLISPAILAPYLYWQDSMEWNAQVHTLSIDKSNNLQEDGSGRAFLESSFGSANLSIECEIRE